MQNLKQPIGILGGTFDPIHHGHLRMGLELYEACQFSKVHLIPCQQPVHRESPLANADHRLAMINCAIQGEPAFIANSCELNRATPSYTIDTLEQLRITYPDTPLCLLLGIDAFIDFLSWHRPNDILKNAHIIVAHRPNFQLPTSGTIIDLIQAHRKNDITYIHQNLAGGILLRSITALEISATEIRKQISNGKNPRYLLPDCVYDYIKEHGLYKATRI